MKSLGVDVIVMRVKIFLNVALLVCIGSFGLNSCTKQPAKPEEESGKWEAINSGLESLYVQCITISPHDKDVIYAGTYGGIFRTTNGGVLWYERSSGLTSDDIKAVAVSPHNANIVFCGTWGQGVFKSEDGGETWVQKNDGIPNPRINSIVFDPNDPQTVYIACADKMLKTIDAGETWTVSFTYGNVRSVAVQPTAENRVYVGIEYHGIFRTDSTGNGWERVNNGLYHTNDGYLGPYDITFDPISPETMYVATYSVDVHKSVDGGDVWTLKSNGVDYRKVRKSVINPINPRIIYAATDRGVMMSADGGDNWSPLSGGLENEKIRTIALHRDGPEMVYAGTYGGGIYRYVK